MDLGGIAQVRGQRISWQDQGSHCVALCVKPADHA
jgi:hypothetical protein